MTTFTQALESQFTADGTTKSIEDIINGIGDDAFDTDQAVQALKMLV
jgi:hypothetical protein